MRQVLPITFLAASLVAAPALAEQNVPITPEDAALACQARVEHDLKEKGGSATALQSFEKSELADDVRRIRGVYAVTIDGKLREAKATCDVSSSNGVKSLDLSITPLDGDDEG